jgi:hypothetical protein
MRKAIVDMQGKVLNVIEIEPNANYSLLVGYRLIDAEKSGSTGDFWDGQKFIPKIVIPTIPPRDLESELDKVKADVVAIKARIGMM